MFKRKPVNSQWKYMKVWNIQHQFLTKIVSDADSNYTKAPSCLF